MTLFNKETPFFHFLSLVIWREDHYEVIDFFFTYAIYYNQF